MPERPDQNALGVPAVPAEPTALGAQSARTLPSGREVRVSADDGAEAIEIRSPDGQMELRIALTPGGPVLRLRGVRLEIDSTDAVAVRCKDFHIEATNGVRLTAGGEVAVKSLGDTNIDAKVINLNSGDRSDYPDGQPGYTPPPFVLPPSPPTPPAGACGHEHAAP